MPYTVGKKAKSPTGRPSKVKPAVKKFMKGKKTGGKRTSTYTPPPKPKAPKAKKRRYLKGNTKLSSASSRAAKRQ